MQTMPTDPFHARHERFDTAAARLPPIDATASQRMGRDDQFMVMLRGFRRSGGLARAHDLTSLLADRSGLNVGTLARWVVDGEVVHFEWQLETWFPMFQFAAPDLARRPGVGPVLKELQAVLDPWDTAQWFACPSAALGSRTPADTMEFDPALVLHAARCDR